jgi:hypothetical protein
MAIDRREAMRISLGGGFAFFTCPPVLPRQSSAAGAVSIKPGGGIDQTEMLQSALDRAAGSGLPLLLPEGLYSTRRLALGSGTHLLGVSGKTVLRCRDGSGLFAATDARDIRIEGLTLDGGECPLGAGSALLQTDAVHRLHINDCRAVGFRGHGFVLRRSSGSITACAIESIGGHGLLGEDIADLHVSRNRLKDCGASAIRLTSIGDCRIDANIVERAATGISLMQRGSAQARIEANEIRHLYFRKYGETQGTGIFAAGHCALIGNIVENAPGYGILLGTAPSVSPSDVRGNRISGAYIGIAYVGSRNAGALAAANRISDARASALLAMRRQSPASALS